MHALCGSFHIYVNVMESHDYLGLIFLSKKETFSFINDLVALVLKVDTLDTLQTSFCILVYCTFCTPKWYSQDFRSCNTSWSEENIQWKITTLNGYNTFYWW